MTGSSPTSTPDLFDSSRRLTGPNLFFAGCGAVLDVFETSPAAIARWRLRLRTMLATLGWPRGDIVVRVHRSGASLAFSAPEDLLLTATEVNEWAWLGAVAAPGNAAIPLAPGHPAPFDDDSALQCLRRMAAGESNSQAMSLLAEAARRGLPVFWDEDGFSIGAGAGGHTWLPAQLPDEVPWSSLHDVPTAVVTGSNGKTTTVRLLAAIFTAAGQAAGFNCTEGVFLAGQCVERGDWSGPAGSRRVLRDPRVQAAVLETARGGLLRRGLAVRRADAAIVTNISPDHYGEYGIHDLSDLADAKLAVARAIGPGGVLVLNADDPVLVAKSSALACPLAWFALDYGHPQLRAQREAGGMACGVREDELILCSKGIEHPLGRIEAMPLSLSGLARYNIANIAGAALVAAAMGIDTDVIASVLARFGRERNDNPGRLERWTIRGAEVLIDYAHNPEGLVGLLAIASALRARSGGRLHLLLGQAGNRDNDAIRELAAVAAAARPDVVVLKDMQGYMRGRLPGEVPQLLREELLSRGLHDGNLRTVLDEAEAALSLFTDAVAGDVVVMPVHGLAAREQFAAFLDDQARMGGTTPASM
jgi:UDP-N-acetylmuramyl tripeptide synthase